jgi:tetratricopeptide (TPR) repeat protein
MSAPAFLRSTLLALCVPLALGACARRVPDAAPAADAPRPVSPQPVASAPAAPPEAEEAPTAPLLTSPGARHAMAEAAYQAGLAALEEKQAEPAIRHLEACVEAAPQRVDCRWELGWGYWLQGRWEQVVAQWSEVQRLEPGHPEVAQRLAQARAQAERGRSLTQASKDRPRPPASAQVRLRAVGDVMLGSDFPESANGLPPEDGATLLSEVRELLKDADLTFVNLEGPLCDSGSTKKCRKGGNCYAFRTPTRYGRYLKEAGVDLASTANNHSGDFGEECRRETEKTLDALDIKWSGAPGTVATTTSNGIRVGLVAFHTSPSCNHLNNHEAAAALVRAAAAAHDVVVVSFHGGAEGGNALRVPHGKEMFFGEDRGDLRVFTHRMVDAGAHLVIGHGPHVVRGMEFYQGRLIAYSLGNFATYGQFNLKGPQGLGAILEVTLDGEGRFLDGRVLPTRQEGKGVPRPDAKGEVLGLLRSLSQEDFPGTGAQLDAQGRILPPPAPTASQGRP